MRSINQKVFTHTILIFSFLLILRCSSSIPNIELNKDYDFSNKKSITIYVIPSGNSELDVMFGRVCFLDLQARGYKVTNANQIMDAHSDLLLTTNHREVADSLLIRRYLPESDLVVVVSSKWDSALVVTLYSENKTVYGKYIRFEGRFAKRLSSQVAFYDKRLPEPILSFSAVDTAYLYSENGNKNFIYSEFPWMIAAKQLTKNFKDIPICNVNNPPPAENQFDISLWVDNTYREKFPKTWKDRLRLRFLYANDILRSQFDIELKIVEFKEWDSRFGSTLESTIRRLEESGISNPKLFRIGITLNGKLKSNWDSRLKLGLSQLLGTNAVITGQPSFPSIAQNWNSLEETITLVHEIGHLFGAIHVPDENSIMYPSSGFLSFEFDDLNKNIIESTKNHFFNVDEKSRAQNYFQELNKLRKSSEGKSLQILESAGSAFNNLFYKKSWLASNQEKLNSLITSISPDSVFAFAVEGYVEYKNKHFEAARKSFIRTLELEPEFEEVSKYLSLIPETTGNYEIKSDTTSNIKNDKAVRKPGSASHKKRN
ncbi:MAG: M12 family metallo-peptidase [Ignavibacteriaceae bacterium]